MQRHQLHDSAARRAEVPDEEMISVTEVLPSRQGWVRNVRHLVRGSECLCGKCLSHGSAQVDWLVLGCLHCIDTFIRSAANAKSPQRSDRGQMSLVGGRLCEAPMKRKGPVLSFSTAPQARSGRDSCSSLTLIFYDYKFHSTNLSYTAVR